MKKATAQMVLEAKNKDAVFQASIDFIKALTGMEPPPIETADAKTFKPFKEFADRVCDIFTKPQDPAVNAELLEAKAEPIEYPALAIITALRFYANGDHLNLDDEEDFDTVSGEPENWLCSGAENSATMVEDGSIARRALQGKLILWNDGDEDSTPNPIEGEILYTAPQETAVNAELLASLETLCNGIEWNIENHPTIMNEADSEALAEARAVIAKATGSAT